MKKPQLYIETSVWKFYFADDAPEKREITKTFFDRISHGEYEIFISDAVIAEIGRANDEKRQLLLSITKEYNPKRLIINEEVMELSQKYITEGGFPANKVEDAIHAAVATVYEMDALISWNLRHLSNLRKMEMINGINMKEGYLKRLELITPMEVCDEEI
jgi:predicted nucleic acid-binding protein